MSERDEDKFPIPEYDRYVDPQEIETEIAKRKDTIYRKTKFKHQVEADKKVWAATFGVQLKQLEEELEYEVGVIGGFEDRLKVLNAQMNAQPGVKAALKVVK